MILVLTYRNNCRSLRQTKIEGSVMFSNVLTADVSGFFGQYGDEIMHICGQNQILQIGVDAVLQIARIQNRQT